MAEEKAGIGMTPANPTAPPSYDSTPSTDAAPPSYQSIFGQIRNEKEKNESPVGFIGSVVRILLGTIFVTMFMAIILAIPITMVAIGAVYVHDCPAERMIPIYLMTMGSAYIIKTLIDLKARAQKSRLPQEEQADFRQNRFESGFSRVLGTFCFGFFIAGNVWIYRIYKPNTSDITGDGYCDPTLYYFAFWVTTVCYIIAGTFCFCGCFISCVASCCCAAAASNAPADENAKNVP